MKHGSLFSGIGGFDLAAEWMGWENVFHCEWDPFGQKILKHYWPDAISYGDITKTDFTVHRGTIDIVTGGFPCQPYSVAGKRKGKADDRHLWPEMLRAIREIQPRWVVGENVFGLVNWSGGLVFDEVQSDLEASFKESETGGGYDVFPFILPACAVNAPHRRDRVWFVAHNKCKRKGISLEKGNDRKDNEKRSTNDVEQNIGSNDLRIITDPKCFGQSGSGRTKGRMYKKEDGNWKASWAYSDGRWPTQSPVCSGNDGLSNELDGITISKHRKESLMGYGNAIVPQVAYEIFKAIYESERLMNIK